MTSPTILLLQSIVRRESRSLLQYVGDAFPWTTLAGKEGLTELQQMVQTERDTVAALVAWLNKNHQTLGYLGSYPMVFTNMNFVTLDYLLPLLVDYEKRAIGDLERDLASLGNGGATPIVQKILEVKRGHLQKLAELAAGSPV